jgi:aldehyde:ferredoxin oxidoreductase
LTDELQIPSNKKSRVPLDILKKKYYKNRSWDKNGVPKKSLIKRLGLAEIVYGQR